MELHTRHLDSSQRLETHSLTLSLVVSTLFTPKGGFDRGFQFSFLGILIQRILFSGIVFPSMCILGRLVKGLNFRENFIHFQNYPWQSNIRQRSAVVGGGLATVGGGPVVTRRWLAMAGGGCGGPVVAQRWRVAAEGNRWWVTIGVI